MENIIEKSVAEILLKSADESHGWGIKSFLDVIDSEINGFKPGKVYLLCGKQRCHKTSLALTISNRIGIDCGIPILYCSLFDSHESLIERSLFQYANVTSFYNNIRTFEEYEIMALNVAAEKMKKSRLKFLCKRNLSANKISEAMLNGEKMVVVDSLELTECGLDILPELREKAVLSNVPMFVVYEFSDLIDKSLLVKLGADVIMELDEDVFDDVFGTDEDGDPIMKTYIEFSILKNNDGKTIDKRKLFINLASSQFYNFG